MIVIRRFFKSSESIFSLSLSEIPPWNWNIAPIELSSASFLDGLNFLSLCATKVQHHLTHANSAQHLHFSRMS